MDKKCVVIDVNLAVVLGVSESIILQQMSYWLEKSTHIIEGRPWIFNSYANWQKQLPFFCESTIRRLIKKLEDMGIILSANFNKCKMDKTKWYSIDFDVLNKLEEKFNESLNNSDNSDAEGNNLHCANKEQMDKTTHERNCSNLALDEINLTKAIPEITPETNYIEEEEEKEIGARTLGETGKIQNGDTISEHGKRKDFNDVINFYNSNLHMITPHEYEKLKLLYEYIKNPDLIIKAMEISVENRGRSFRYIESILYNWTELNLHSLREVEDYIKNYEITHRVIVGKDDNHGEKKYSGTRQYSSYNKKAQGENQAKYAGFKPEEPELPEFTEDDFDEFL